ncbi:hypothetical protein [Paraburkholderia sabiae]|uniref:Uncharacterized protein n=1 Tax=Paraburkholderia sabiae TaxID=273251 RepID=A0ABU9QLL4_9BURK|nr:hypothetical protein [Paraburkholderia sabiae]WJZ79663.1 hypothetical protein QEN71_41060 [Paraburkholderia sabiae]
MDTDRIHRATVVNQATPLRVERNDDAMGTLSRLHALLPFRLSQPMLWPAQQGK